MVEYDFLPNNSPTIDHVSGYRQLEADKTATAIHNDIPVPPNLKMKIAIPKNMQAIDAINSRPYRSARVPTKITVNAEPSAKKVSIIAPWTSVKPFQTIIGTKWIPSVAIAPPKIVEEIANIQNRIVFIACVLSMPSKTTRYPLAFLIGSS